MGRVHTNRLSFSYKAEESLGVPGNAGAWTVVEPNSFPNFGASITTVERDPISSSRQRRKGSVTDLDSTVEFDSDLTLSSYNDFISSFVFAKQTNDEVMNLNIESIAADGANLYLITLTAPLTAAQVAKLGEFSLVATKGFANAVNNGIFTVDETPANGATTITIFENAANSVLIPEVVTGRAELSLGGVAYDETQPANAQWDYNELTGRGTFTVEPATLPVDRDLTDYLTPGQFVYLGVRHNGTGEVNYCFETNDGQKVCGFARVISVGAKTFTADKLSEALKRDGVAGGIDEIALTFGSFIRNVPSVNNDEYLESSFVFEMAYPNLEADGETGYEYAYGNLCNTMAISLPLSDKSTVSFGFIGTDTPPPTDVRLPGADAPNSPIYTEAFNTSADIGRLTINKDDGTSLTTDFKSATLTLSNNVSPEKVLGSLGARFMNTGNFEVSLEAEVLFTDPGVVESIRNNETVSFDVIMTNNDNGAIVIDVPSMTMGDGSRNFPVNETVTLTTTGSAFEDATLGTSIGTSFIAQLPDNAK